MKIIELRGENVKIIKAIRIRPKGNTVIISGKNGAGKTSALDLIWYCLDGGKSLKNTPIPIRKGETKAKAVTVLAEPTEEEELAIERGEEVILKPLFIVTRTWTEKGSYLKVTNAQEEIQQSPQELLDSFIGMLTFDPLKFAQMKEKEQRELLLKLANIDLEELDNEIIETRERRRLQGQKVKMLTGEREKIIMPEGLTVEDLPEEKMSLSDESEILQKALYENQQLERNIEGLEESKIELHRLESEVDRFKILVKARKDYIKNHKHIDVDSMKSHLLEAESTNQLIDARDRNRAKEEREEGARIEYDVITSNINELEDIKRGILDKAKMPIVQYSRIRGKEKPAGDLSVSDTGVVFNNIPYSQLAQSEKLKVSMGMAMAMNPKLRVLRITDGSLLDDESMELIKLMAKKNDFQIWIERVSGSGEVGFRIEDGEIKDGS